MNQKFGGPAEKPTDVARINDGGDEKKSLLWFAAMAFVFVIPIVLINLPGVQVWIGRTIAVSSFMFFVPVGVFWFGLNPKTKMIRAGGKLATPQFDNLRPKIERAIRIVVVTFGIFFLVSETIPLAMDLIHLADSDMPTKFTDTVTSRTTALGGVLLGESSVRFAHNERSYYLFYSWLRPLRVGESYEFTVLPRSRAILEFHTTENTSSFYRR